MGEKIFHFIRKHMKNDEGIELLNVIIADDPEIARAFLAEGFA
jgi:hypothetical protein